MLKVSHFNSDRNKLCSNYLGWVTTIPFMIEVSPENHRTLFLCLLQETLLIDSFYPIILDQATTV